MLRNQLRRAASGRLIFGTPHVGLLASQIISETAAGDSGPGLLYNEAQSNAGKQLRVKITSYTGTPGKLFVYENGSILIEGEADGAYAIGYDWEAWSLDGLSLTSGSDTASVQVGAINATAPGATLVGTSSLSSGAASGQGNATAPGATLTGASTITAGTASGGVAGDASAPGANLSGPSTITPGSAVGNQNAVAPGSTLTGPGTINPGAASGDLSAAAPGATLTGTSSLQAGSANNATLTVNPRYIVKAPRRDLTVKAGARNYTVKR